MRFLEASNYCLGYSDSDRDDYDPSWECFNLEFDTTAPVEQGGAGRDTQTYYSLVPGP